MDDLFVDSVTKNFGYNQVLTDVYLSCRQGEIIGLLGRNGSGKSTLMKIIFGSLQADTRFVKVGNRILNGIYDNRNMIRYLPQETFLPNHFKVSKIITLFCDKENAESIRTHELISPLLNRRARELSGGEKRLVEIFLVIYAEARFVLVDEPFNGIAPLHKNEIKRIILEQSQRKGFIVTDHDFRNILDVSTRIILMHDGGTKVIHKPEELAHWGYIPEKSGEVNP